MREYLDARVDQAPEEGEKVDVSPVHDRQEMEMSRNSVEGKGELYFNEYEQLEYTDEVFDALPEFQEMNREFAELRARTEALVLEARQEEDAMGPVRHEERRRRRRRRSK